MRDNVWLQSKLTEVWKKYFNDVEKLNAVDIHFGKKAKRRLASIRQKTHNNKQSDTEIRVTSYYKDEKVPEYVVETTIAHELCHYAHGFASPHPQYFSHPHRGDVVDTELKKRGLGQQLELQEKWLRSEWIKVVGEDIFTKKIRITRRRRQKTANIGNSLLKFIRGFGYN